MNKKIFIPISIAIVIIVIALITCSDSGKVQLEWKKISPKCSNIDSIELQVYVENSGSMDAYMCSGSNLKDAVFDYVSDLNKLVTTCSLNYVNSIIIPYQGNLQTYIKDLTPSSFAKAGGNRANTDLRYIFDIIMSRHKLNTITLFVSDCILDIPQSATDFFGNCQISIKNTFNEALKKNPNLGVEIIQLQSKFNGYWYCGKNMEKLLDVKRPYYIWLIGDKRILADFNKKVPVHDIIGGISGYCAYSTSQPIPFDITKETYVINHTNEIHIQLLTNLDESLQDDSVIKDVSCYKTENQLQSSIVSVEKITNKSIYSHVIEISISNPETIRYETISFSYPYLASWVENANDSTGQDIKQNINKTTGILYLIKGVAEAYKPYLSYGNISFNLKNK